VNGSIQGTLVRYRILQATIIGVIVLHLLLIPGTAFIAGGARIMSQDLTPHINELNHVLLTMGWVVFLVEFLKELMNSLL